MKIQVNIEDGKMRRDIYKIQTSYCFSNDEIGVMHSIY
jgi:hypothetical protein